MLKSEKISKTQTSVYNHEKGWTERNNFFVVYFFFFTKKKGWLFKKYKPSNCKFFSNSLIVR